MANNSENGHAINVTNFENLITSVTAFGATYNPSKDSIKLPALQTLLTNANQSLTDLNTVFSAYSAAVDERELAFQPMGKLITRANNALKASGASSLTIETAQTIVRKLQGKRATAKLTDEEIKALEAQGKEVNQISASQMGYDSKVLNLDKFISLFETVPEYTPNEEELKISALKLVQNQLKTKNSKVISTGVQLTNARAARNEILYKPLTGLVDIAGDVKTYVKSAFGASSIQFRQISKLKFTAYK